jgi:DNA invertase Pin-like site-specific DNA recombinase
VYEDNDISASTRSRKPRPDYQQLLADARAGLFSIVIAYTSSRLTRRIREHEDLIELAEQHGVQFIYVRSPSLDLNDASGRTVARILAATDVGEAENIAERVKRAVKQRATSGEFHGGAAPFGQQAIKEVINGRERVVAFQLHTEHAAWVREAAERVLAGETIYGVCVNWNAKGRLSGEGKRWYPRTLKRLLIQPSVIGKRETDGQLYPAPWGPILDERTWTRLCDLLNDPDRRTSTSNKRKYALSGLLFCGLCDNRLTSTSENRADGPSFECSRMKTGRGGCGKIRIVMRPLESYIAEQVFTRLDSPEMSQALAGDREGMDDAERELRQAVEDDERRLERLTNEYDDDKVPEQEYRRRRARITDRLEANQSKLRTITRATARAAVPSGAELREVWPTKDNTWKRTILSSVIERITVGPHPVNPETGRLFTSAPSRRRGEAEDAWRARFELTRAQTFAHRVDVTWWY